MHGHPLLHRDSDRCDFTPPSPYARVPLVTACTHPERGKRVYDDLLEPAHVLMHVPAICTKIDDCVEHELPRPVVGHIPAAAALVYYDPTPAELGLVCANVLLPRRPAQSDARLVFDEH